MRQLGLELQACEESFRKREKQMSRLGGKIRWVGLWKLEEAGLRTYSNVVGGEEGLDYAGVYRLDLESREKPLEDFRQRNGVSCAFLQKAAAWKLSRRYSLLFLLPAGHPVPWMADGSHFHSHGQFIYTFSGSSFNSNLECDCFLPLLWFLWPEPVHFSPCYCCGPSLYS